MFIQSNLINSINSILSKIQGKLSFLTDNSYLFANIDNLLFTFISVSVIASIFLGNNSTAPFLIIVGILYLFMLLIKNGAELRLNNSSFFILLYFIVAVISTINSTMFHQSCFGLSKTVLYLLFFCAAMQYFRFHRDKIFWISLVISACVCFEIVIAFMQNYLHVMSAATWQDVSQLNPELVLTRVYGTLQPSNPNLLGGYLIAAIPFLWLATAISFVRKYIFLFTIGLVFSFLTVPTVFMTGCRGAYVALFIMLIILLVVTVLIIKKHNPDLYNLLVLKKNYIISVCSAGIVMLLICVPKITHRIISIFAMRNDSSTSFRMNVYNSSVQMFQDNFLFGIGCGNKVFREMYGLYMLSGFDALSAYSVFLETAVESGIFALIFYLCFIFFLFKNAIITFFNSIDIEEKIILAAGIISVAGVMVHGFVDTVYFRPQIQLIFWITIAMIYSYTDELKNDNQ